MDGLVRKVDRVPRARIETDGGMQHRGEVAVRDSDVGPGKGGRKAKAYCTAAQDCTSEAYESQHRR
jgi:hypothetical protein